jgi:hypothetical protein
MPEGLIEGRPFKPFSRAISRPSAPLLGIDDQAVDVTKLSLLLKVLEGETEQTIQAFLSVFRERALPDLDTNFKCGNSLIASDFYQEDQLALDDVELAKEAYAFASGEINIL